MAETGESEFLTGTQAARLLGVRSKTLARWAERGDVPFLRPFGTGHRRYRRADIERLRADSERQAVNG
jgi:excisionase family DNA binding protein